MSHPTRWTNEHPDVKGQQRSASGSITNEIVSQLMHTVRRL